MNFGELQTDVKTYTGSTDATKVKAVINAAYRTMVNRFFWPQLNIECATPITLVAGTQDYGLASDFRWMKSVFYRDNISGFPIFLNKSRNIFQNAGTGAPFRVRIKKNKSTFAWNISFDVIPDSTFISQYPLMYYEYYYQPPNLSSDSDTPRFDAGDHDLIAYLATILILAKQDDAPGFTMFQALYQDGVGDMEEKSIDFFGRPLGIPGKEITEDDGGIITDYGMPIGRSE